MKLLKGMALTKRIKTGWIDLCKQFLINRHRRISSSSIMPNFSSGSHRIGIRPGTLKTILMQKSPSLTTRWERLSCQLQTVTKSKTCEQLSKSVMQCGLYMSSANSMVLKMETPMATMRVVGTPFMIIIVTVKTCTILISLSVLRTQGILEISTLSMQDKIMI